MATAMGFRIGAKTYLFSMVFSSTLRSGSFANHHRDFFVHRIFVEVSEFGDR